MKKVKYTSNVPSQEPEKKRKPNSMPARMLPQKGKKMDVSMFNEAHQNVQKLTNDEYGSNENNTNEPIESKMQQSTLPAPPQKEKQQVFLRRGRKDVFNENYSDPFPMVTQEPAGYNDMQTQIISKSKPEVFELPNFFNFIQRDNENKHYTTLQEAMQMKDALEVYPTQCSLKFYGTSTTMNVTDLVFYTLMIHNSNSKLTKVVDIDLSACIHISDLSLQWIANTFPSLTSIKLAGCNNITESGLYHIVTKCTSLTTIDISGTSVCILPKKLCKMTVNTDGIPCVSPEKEILNKMGLKVLESPSYAKPANTDLVKMCIIQWQDSRQSLIKHFSQVKDKYLDPLESLNEFRINDRFLVNMVECIETIADLFITKRTLYVFVVHDGDEAKHKANQILAHIYHIINKVHRAAFLIVGMNEGTGLLLESIMNLISANVKSTTASLNKNLHSEFKDKGDHIGGSIEEQNQLMSKVMLARCLENIHLESIEINTSKPIALGSLKPFVNGLEKICEMYPEFQEVAEPTFKFLMSNTVETMLKAGVVSLETNTGSNQKMMELLAIMGRTLCFSVIDDVNAVCLVSWLAKVLKIAFSPLNTLLNNGRVHGINDATPLWTMEEMKTVLAKSLGQEQAEVAGALLFKLGLSVYPFKPNLYLPFHDLPKDPEVPVEHFFPEIPPYQKKQTLFYTVGYQASFETLVPAFVVRQILYLCSKLRRWQMAWQKGCIIQEAVIETLIELKQDKRDVSSLCLYTHTVKGSQDNDVEKQLHEMVWNAILQYKIVFEYIFKQNNMPYDLKLVVGQEPSADMNVSGLISNHPYQVQTREDNQPEQILCTSCGIHPSVASLPWILKSMTNTVAVNEDSTETKGEVILTGSVARFTGIGHCVMKMGVTSNQLKSYKVYLLAGQTKQLRVGVGYGFVRKQFQFLGSIYLELGTGAVIKKIHEDNEEKKTIVGNISEDKIPRIGNTVSIVVKGRESHMFLADLCFYRNAEMIFSTEVSNHLYLPALWTENDPGLEEPTNSNKLTPQMSDLSVSLMLYPMFRESNHSHVVDEILPGMRLEAIDRKNPHLCCVATIAEVKDDGTVLIHFDGWSNNFDYLAEPTSTDLHPIGWLESNIYHNRNLNVVVQPPKDWPKVFTWSSYLEENNFLPVPYNWFTAEQIGNTPYQESIEAKGLMKSGVTQNQFRCGKMKNRARVVEYNTLQKCKMTPKLFEFFNVHSKFFCLLPAEFNVSMLKYPCIQAVMDLTKQNIHILCPGLKMELLHFIDDRGVPISDCPNIMFDPQNVTYLLYCLFGLLIQQETLPSKCSQLIPGIESLTTSKTGIQTWLHRLLFLYMCMYDIYIKNTDKDANVILSRALMDVYNATVKQQQKSGAFSEGDHYIRCRGHAVSSMANNDLKEIPMEEFAQMYSFMTKLDFQNNQIEKLPDDFLTTFTALESLNLSRNQISVLPEGFPNMKELMDLDISSNQIQRLPADFKSVKDTLISLNISHNPFHCLPEVIFEIVNLQDLIAENIGVIGDLSRIRNLMLLQTLNLGKNSIAAIPEELGDLPLTSLDLSGVPWFPKTELQSYTSFITFMNSNMVTGSMSKEEQQKMFSGADIDQSTTLTPNEILSLNYDVLFVKYPRFGNGQLAYEKTGGIPPAILNLKNLKKLVLSYHGIKLIPDEVKELKALQELDLSYNPKMVTLSAELGELPIKKMHLTECLALNTPPKEIVARGLLAVMGYLKRLRLGASPCKRTKLMMVGLGGAGKTSLVQSLLNSKYRAYMDKDEPITDGIDISKWVISIGDNDNLTFSVWDFAGQTVYYNTHQFFLSNRAVYLLLWNVRQGYEHAGLDFWLSSIACHAPKAPILVVGTHIDKVEKYKLPEENLKSRYPQITGFQYVSCYTGHGVNELSKVIIDSTLQQKYMGEKIPEAWLTLENRLIQYREEKNVDILPFKTLETVSQTCGIFDKAELVQAVQFLHDLGAVQFFDTDFLRNMVVIFPQWIVDVMACLVTVHQGAVVDGKLMLKDIGKVWSAYPSELHTWLLRLTEEFDLTCPLPEEDASIVPCLLPDAEPKYEWPQADPDNGIKESLTVYKFQYLPAGLFNRAQVRLHNYSKGALLWKTGSYLKKNDHIALMQQTNDQEVVVRAQGFRPENFLFIVHEMFENLITESYSGVHYDYLVPCMDCLSMNVKDPSMVSYRKVRRGMELNVPFIQCEKFFHILSIQELRDAMPSDKMSDVDNHLRNSVRELIDLTQETTISVFFVYSSKNIPDLKDEDKLVHPGTIVEDLRKQDVFKVSYTDKPESSDMEALTLSMKSSDVIAIGMSDEFCDNPDCRKLLLYVKDVLQKPVLLILLGTTKKWQNGDINIVFGTEVYVDMQNKQRYPIKLVELYEIIKKKAAVQKQVKEETLKCFISYCWANSHEAISKGTKAVDGALGWNKGDPREVKRFIEEKGIKCWLDVEQVGGAGLFTSIADGLKEAEVLLAFVSDQYVKSKNCVMEFRYALTTLRIPVIIVAVGTGYEWERSEVGLLSVGHKCPKVNLQYPNDAGYLEILGLVKKIIESKSSPSTADSNLTQRAAAFQEVLELTQRKFLRHITTSFISNDLEPYPCLFVVDFISDKERQDLAKYVKEKEMVKKQQEQDLETNASETIESTESRIAEMPVESSTDVGKVITSKYCIRVLCENPQGWHTMNRFLLFPDDDPEEQQQLIDSAAPYLSRVYTIIKHSNIPLECLTTPEGEVFIQRLEEMGIKGASDFKDSYLSLRTLAMQQDKHRKFCSLIRSQVNGKMAWLCDTHRNAARTGTEKRFGDKKSDIPIPTGGLPEEYILPEVTEEVDAKVMTETQEANRPRKLFRRNISGKPGGLQRQTSQMCLVM